MSFGKFQQHQVDAHYRESMARNNKEAQAFQAIMQEVGARIFSRSTDDAIRKINHPVAMADIKQVLPLSSLPESVRKYVTPQTVTIPHNLPPELHGIFLPPPQTSGYSNPYHYDDGSEIERKRNYNEPVVQPQPQPQQRQTVKRDYNSFMNNKNSSHIEENVTITKSTYDQLLQQLQNQQQRR